VARLWVNLRQVAENHLLELQRALQHMVTDPAHLASVSRETLLEQRDAVTWWYWMCAPKRSTPRPICPLRVPCLWLKLNNAWPSCRRQGNCRLLPRPVLFAVG